MIINLTKKQGDELLNTFWNVDYTVDGVDYNTGEDSLHEIPPVVNIGQLGTVLSDPEDPTSITGYVMAHPALTDEDEIILKDVLDERVAFSDSVRAADTTERAGMRSTKRAELRTQARQDTRRAARVALRRSTRREDRIAARLDFRESLKTQRVLDRIAARKAEREAEAEAAAVG